MTSNIGVIIVEKSGNLKPLRIKSFDEDELYKKCGFKSKENFVKYTEWNVTLQTVTYHISLYGKNSGKAMSENKYDFPPPHDNVLFFGNCVLVCRTQHKGETGEPLFETLDVDQWEKIYEKLFGGFEDLGASATEDEHEIDELENIPTNMKTRDGGYLKDGFVVEDCSESSDHSQGANTTESLVGDETDTDDGSELEEEDYMLEEDSN